MAEYEVQGPFGGHSDNGPTETPDVAGEPFTNEVAGVMDVALADHGQRIADTETATGSLADALSALEQAVSEIVISGGTPEFQVVAGWLEWRIVDGDGPWTQLFDLSSLQPADGIDGRELELRVAEGVLQSRYVGETSWTPLVVLSDAIDIKRSITRDGGALQLVGDVNAPGADKVYGTDASGVRGWRDAPPGGSPPFAEVEWDDDNSAARPDAGTVYWKGWPDHLTPTNAQPGDLVFSPGGD